MTLTGCQLEVKEDADSASKRLFSVTSSPFKDTNCEGMNQAMNRDSGPFERSTIAPRLSSVMEDNSHLENQEVDRFGLADNFA